MDVSPAYRGGLERTLPWGGADEVFAKYFAEVTLDVVEEQTFQKRFAEEVGPRLVHLRKNAMGEPTIPPHVEENPPGQMVCQLWTGHPKVDRSMFIMDRTLEMQTRIVRDMGSQKHVPCLRASLDRKNFGRKPGPKPFTDSFRSIVLNSSRRPPHSLQYIDKMPAYYTDDAVLPLLKSTDTRRSSSTRRRVPLSARG
mmetsp:Transcript_65255/g.103400  ORF Transcript_65255/g.103400 Transcript_65255/m.103400 type:complete len:197 (+) Transcript_65255:45-635(+)